MTSPKRDVEVIEKRTAYQGYYRVDVYRLRHSLYRGGMGPEITREILDRGQAVMVLPYDPIRDEVVLIEQFRMGPFVRGDQPWSLEVVAGMIEDGEDKEDVARREAKEEAGIELFDMKQIMGCYTSLGAVTEYITIFFARTDSTMAGGIHGVAEEGEDIKVVVLSFDEVMVAMEAGIIRAAPVIVAVQWLALHREEIRARWLK